MYRGVTRANKVILLFCEIIVVRVCACNIPCISFLNVPGILRFVPSRANEASRASRRQRGRGNDEAENHVRETTGIRASTGDAADRDHTWLRTRSTAPESRHLVVYSG